MNFVLWRPRTRSLRKSVQIAEGRGAGVTRRQAPKTPRSRCGTCKDSSGFRQLRFRRFPFCEPKRNRRHPRTRLRRTNRNLLRTDQFRFLLLSHFLQRCQTFSPFLRLVQLPEDIVYLDFAGVGVCLLYKLVRTIFPALHHLLCLGSQHAFL